MQGTRSPLLEEAIANRSRPALQLDRIQLAVSLDLAIRCEWRVQCLSAAALFAVHKCEILRSAPALRHLQLVENVQKLHESNKYQCQVLLKTGEVRLFAQSKQLVLLLPYIIVVTTRCHRPNHSGYFFDVNSSPFLVFRFLLPLFAA